MIKKLWHRGKLKIQPEDRLNYGRCYCQTTRWLLTGLYRDRRGPVFLLEKPLVCKFSPTEKSVEQRQFVIRQNLVLYRCNQSTFIRHGDKKETDEAANLEISISGNLEIWKLHYITHLTPLGLNNIILSCCLYLLLPTLKSYSNIHTKEVVELNQHHMLGCFPSRFFKDGI